MNHRYKVCLAIALIFFSATPVFSATLVEEDFDDNKLKERGFFDINWGKNNSKFSIVGSPEMKPFSGKGCLKVNYTKGSEGGWMHQKLKGVPEFYCRYYRYFPKGWEWPKGYGPHDTMVTAGRYLNPTGNDLAIYLDFWRTSETFVRVATAMQKWGYGGYAGVLRRKGGRSNALPYNVNKPDLMTTGRWHCVEFHAKLNDAGKENGQLRLWVNGKLVSDLRGLELRDSKHSTILFNRWILGPYFHGGSHKAQHNYMDALVISTNYIGTVEQKGNQPPQAQFSVTRAWRSMKTKFDAAKSADPEGAKLSYQWDFGDGKKGTGMSPSHTFSKAGEFVVKLTVTDNKAEAHVRQKKITVDKSVGSGVGLKAEYFSGVNLTGKPIVLLAKQVNFRRQGWAGRYLSSYIGDTNGTDYSCRWSGFVQPQKSEKYTLTLAAHEGGRLWWGNKLLIDNWDTSGTKSVAIGNLIAGKLYPIRIEHRKSKVNQNGPNPDHEWRCILSWESQSTKKEPIPAGQFYPPKRFQLP